MKSINTRSNVCKMYWLRMITLYLSQLKVTIKSHVNCNMLQNEKNQVKWTGQFSYQTTTNKDNKNDWI